MANSTTTLHGDILLVNQLELVTPTTVGGAFYGIAFTLFCLYVHALVPRLRSGDRKGQSRFMLGYSAVIMLCGLYYLVANAWVTQDAYIMHANSRGGPYAYTTSTYRTPVIIIGLVCQVLVEVLTTAIQIWRVWVIWSATRYAKLIIVLPSLCFLTSTALLMRTVILETTLPFEQVVELDAGKNKAQTAIRGATTVLCTALISLFLIFQHWRQRKLMGKARGSTGYMKIVAMLIESYALESIWVLTTVNIVQVVGAFFAETQTYIVIIAYLLVLYRVASGNAYESQREQNHMSSLHWNHSDHVTTQFGETNEVGNDHDASVKLEAPNLKDSPVSSMV